MLRNYQEGHHARPNSHASLANTGRIPPGARRPQAGAIQQAHRPDLTTRPGPQPLTARVVLAVHQRTAKTTRAVDQVMRYVKDEVRLPTLPYGAYQPGAPGRAPWQETQDEFGQSWFATEVQHIWVYSHEINRFGDKEFMVANPRTGTRVYFRPVGYYDGQLKNIASATGEFGRVYANTLGTIVVVATGGIALEAGGGALLSEYAAPYLTKDVLTGFGMRAGRDFGIQFTSGFLTSKGSLLDRGSSALADINYSSVLIAGIINTEGLKLRFPARLLMATGIAASGNLVTMKYANMEKHKSFFYGVDLHDSTERNTFLIGVGASGLLDVSTEWLTPRLAIRLGAKISGRAASPMLRYVKAAHYVMPMSFGIGTTFETGKKTVEHILVPEDEAKEGSKSSGQTTHHKGPTVKHRSIK